MVTINAKQARALVKVVSTDACRYVTPIRGRLRGTFPGVTYEPAYPNERASEHGATVQDRKER